MDRRSWLWRRKSLEKSPGETESSGSASSYSGRYSDDQEILRASPNDSSPNHALSREVLLDTGSTEAQETSKGLTEKLTAPLSNISVKEDLVKQHMKVAEEAVSGWEKAETELTALKQQLEAVVEKNSILEERVGHLDGALKESVRQLRQAREEQENKVHDVVTKKTHAWESDKFELEKQINELQVQMEGERDELKAQLEAVKSEDAAPIDHELRSKLEFAEKENIALRAELLARTEDLQMQTLEKELTIRTAERASKQHLESIKKVAKLEAECRGLRAAAHRTLLASDHNPVASLASSVCEESYTDSYSDSGERLICLGGSPNCSDSWALALIAELDQFKNEKVHPRNLATSMEIDLMDDFLEMERLVAMHERGEAILESSGFELETASIHAKKRGDQSKGELETVRHQMVELEEKTNNMETDKSELQMALADTQNRLELPCNQLMASAKESKLVAMEVVAMGKREDELESELESLQQKSGSLYEKVHILEGELEKEKSVSVELAAKLESVEGARKILECQLEFANFKVQKLQEEAHTLEGFIEGEKAVSADFAAKLYVAETARKELEAQLDSANSETAKQCEKLDVLIKEVEEKAVSTEFAAEVEALESERKALGCQLESAHLEVEKLHDEVILLECKVEEERSLSSGLAAKLEVSEAASKALQRQLDSAQLQVLKLRDEASLLEDKVAKEKDFSAELTTKCHNFECDLSKRIRDAEVQHVMSVNGELMTKQEKELTVAAGKLVDCQRTIASISRQLNLLTSFDDDFLLDADAGADADKPEVNEGSSHLRKEAVEELVDNDYSNSTVDKEGVSPQSLLSPPSVYEFSRLESRNSTRIEMQ